MSKLFWLYNRIWTGKYWHNVSQFCNRKRHPPRWIIDYRPYRRGKNRCVVCGAKIGKIMCVRYAYKDKLVDNVFSSNSILDLLKRRGAVE